MKKKDIIVKIADMIYSGGFIARSGSYDLPYHDFVKACESLLKTGEGHLDEYDHLTWLSWEEEGDRCLSDRDMELFERIKNCELFWNVYQFFSVSDIDKIQRMVDFTTATRETQETAAYRRRVACAYTAKVKKKVFERDGAICKHCQATENLSLDHIQPVSQGGEDTLENMQVLCKSCNSKKSNK